MKASKFDKRVRELDFDPEGKSRTNKFLNSPIDSTRAWSIAEDAKKETLEEYPETMRNRGNNKIDAFRHALGSYMITRRYGSKASKQILDRHERSPKGGLSPQDTEMGMLQDLYNNRVGRDAALDPKNKDRDPVEVIKELYNSGKLQTRPFRLKQKKRK